MTPAPDHNNNDWIEWKNHVLKELERLADNQEHVMRKVDALRMDMTILKTKAAMWGGAVAFIVTALLELAIRSMK